MTDSNTVYVNDKKIKKVIITADSEGNNIPNFKYNRQNNTWWINDEIISNAIIITDNGGNNAFKSLLELESKDVFKEVLLTVHEANQSKHVNINLLLEKKRLNFINKLRCASEAFHTSSYLKAYKTYKECLQIYDADDYPDEFLLTTNDLVAIKLALALSRLGLGEGEDLKDALHILMTLKAHCVKQYPILCYYLGLTFYLLHFYEEAQSILQEGLKNLEEVDCLNELYWPGSNEQTIYLSDKATLASDLETLYNECKIYRKPDALCQYLSCPNKSIFFSNPCFNGYVNMKCSKDCNFSFHRECWKHKLKNNQIKKPSLLIDSACGTPDCGGLLKEILIYDKRLNINTTIPSNAKISETSKKLETKPGVNATDLTEKPVPDNKSDKKLTSDSFSKFKTTEQKNTLSSFEKNTQVNNNHSESKLNSFAKEYVPIHNQSTNWELNLTNSGCYDTQNYSTVDEAALVSNKCQNLLNITQHSPVNTNKLNFDKPENENTKTNCPNNLNELLNPHAEIFVPMEHQKPLKSIESMALNSVNCDNFKCNTPSLVDNASKMNLPNVYEKQLKRFETVLVTSHNLNTQNNLKNDSSDNSENLLNTSVFIPYQKPICIEETFNNSNKLYSDEPQNLEKDCITNLINLFNPNLPSFVPRTDIILTKEFNSDLPENLENDCVNNLNNLCTASVPIDCQKPLKRTDRTSDPNIINSFNLDANPFVPIACQTPFKTKIREAVCVSSINNSCSSTVEPYVSETSAEAKKISKFVALNHIGEDEKILTTQKFVFVNTHTQTSIQTKEKQIQTVRMEKPHQNTPQTKEKRIQTDRSYSTEINSLKAQIDILRVQLFQAEEAYNELLHKYNGHSEKKKKLTFDCETQTPNAPCTDCKKNQNLLEEKAAEGAAFKIKNQELLNINKELRTLTTDLKATVARNKSNYEKNNKALIKENLNLKTTVQSLQSSLAKKCDTKEINIPIAFQKLLTEQFNHINETYMSYFSMYENKCKYMTWELHDLISLATYDSFPSQQELEENLAEWTTAQEKCKRNQQLVTTFFSKLALKYSPEHFTKVTVATPLPNLLKEPPNIMMRHFKAILALNRKLEQDMNKNLLTFYTQPQPQPQLNNENINSKFLETFGACSSPQPSSVPADNAAKETEIKDPPRPNLFNSIATNEIASNSSTISKPPMKKDSVPKPTLVGQDKLLQRIEQHFPLAPPQTLTTALQTIRQRHGGLTGRDFKSIVLEVKTLIKDISGSTKEKVKISPSKQSNENASLPPWKQVASGVKWSNENPDLNCTICFDFMEKRNSVNLRCQHMFHSKCIRKWLQTNSVCPICRMFAILDDEFPPLK